MSSKICRLCLATPSVYFSLLDKEIPKMLEKLTSIRIDGDVDVSTISCIKCFLNLKLAYNIQQNILRADERLRNNDVPDLDAVKLEVLDPIIENLECPPSTSIESKIEVLTPATTRKTFKRFKIKKTTEGPFQCTYCDKKFSTKHQFRSHSHEKRKCPICNAEISKTNFKKHVTNHSSGPQTCEICGATLRSLESLRGHLSHTHSTKTFCCEDCGQIFKKKYSYLMHMKKHKGERNHVCDTCGKSFYTRFTLKKHIEGTHMKLRPYICKYCQKAFSSRFALRTHERQHTNETPYRCPICGEGFRQNVSLKAHKRSKHNIEEVLTAACSVCGKEFASEHAVISHMRLH